MDYSRKELMTDDCFKVLKFICCDIFEFKLIKIILWETFFVHLVVNIVTVYFFIYHLNAHEIILYCPAVLCMLYPMFGILVLLLKNDILEAGKRDFPHWSLESTCETIHKKIIKQVKYISSYAVFNIIISSVGGLSFVEKLSLDEQYFFALRFFKEFVPSHSKFLGYLYKIHVPLLGYIMIVHAYQALYYTQHQNFQFYMFQPYIESISKWNDHSKEQHLFNDLCYQKELKKRLIFCIQRSKEFINYKKTFARRIILLVVGFSVLGCLLGLGVTMYFFSKSVTPEYYFRMGLTAAGAIFVFSGLIWSGQSYENIFQDMEAAVKNVKWYNFNKKNKSIYLIFLINITRERGITFIEKKAINYKLGLSVVRGIYSVMSVMVNMNRTEK